MVILLTDQFLPAKEKRYIVTTELSASGKLGRLAYINKIFLDKIKFIYLKTKKKAMLSKVV